MEVQCDVDINNAKIQPAQIHFHSHIVLYDMLASFIGIKASQQYFSYDV
jgi:hypothetical protein